MKNITRAIKLTATDIVSRMGMRGLIAYTKLLSLVPGGAQIMVDVMDRHDNGLFDSSRSILKWGIGSEKLHRAYVRGGKREAIMTYRTACRYTEMYNTIRMIAYYENKRHFQKEEP